MSLKGMGSEMPDYSNMINPAFSDLPLPKAKPRGTAIGDKAVGQKLCNMAFNENALGPSPLALEAMKADLKNSHLYPDDSYIALKEALAAKHGITEDMLHITNGGSEFLYLIGRLFLTAGDETIVAKPTFMLYPDIALQTKAKLVEVKGKNHEHDLMKMADAITDRTKVIWVANPCNPTGTYNNADEVDAFVEAVDDRCLIVFDEAYSDFVSNGDFPRTVKYVLEGRKVCLMYTFSKNYGLAGQRIGYGITDTDLATYLPAVRIRFSVSTTAQAAALAALGDADYIERSRKFVREARQFFYREFDRMGLSYVPTQANFILVEVERDCRSIGSGLKKKGFLIRPGWIFGLDKHLRVSYGTMEENERFIKALEEVLGEVN